MRLIKYSDEEKWDRTLLSHVVALTLQNPVNDVYESISLRKLVK